MKTQDRCAKTQYLTQLIDDTLAESERTLLEEHVESCEVCQHALDVLVEEDETVARVHLRQSEPLNDEVLLSVMDRIRSTTGAMGSVEPIRLDDFAVDYLHPSDDPASIGRLGPYEVSDVIGSGGMGIVLKAFDGKLNRVVAIKVLSPVFAMNTTARKRFLREAQAAAAVGHPNVVTIHSVDEDRLPYLVMEFVDGPTLQQRLDGEGFLQINQILRIGVHVASGLAAAHAQGLVHRDIKPGNILLENGMERVKLTDFGLARAADDASVTREGTVVGTPQYMSPEQARGESVDQTSDLFSFGSVLYALATGRPPFRADSSLGVMRRISEEAPTPIRELNPDIPDWFCAIVDRLMAKPKEDRFATAVEVHHLLESCLSHSQQPTVAALPKIPELPKQNRLSQFQLFLSGVTAMVTIATVLFFVFGFSTVFPPDAGPADGSGVVNGNADAERTSDQSAKTIEIGSSSTLKKEITASFANPGEVGTLNVDIKRGSIYVSGYKGDKVIVELSVPKYFDNSSQQKGGLKKLRANTLDFDVETSEEQIKVDGNSYNYITNLTIKVPYQTNLILDSYRDGVIRVKDVEGTFKLRSQNNDIGLVNVAGSGRLYAYNGNLTADFRAVTEGESLAFETYNGSVDVTLPSDTKANVQYRCGKGEVSTDFDLKRSEEELQFSGSRKVEFDEFIRGTINGGGPKLILETENGDIQLRRRMDKEITVR